MAFFDLSKAREIRQRKREIEKRFGSAAPLVMINEGLSAEAGGHTVVHANGGGIGLGRPLSSDLTEQN